MMKQEAGFSLVELLIAIAIVGIIVSVVPSVCAQQLKQWQRQQFIAQYQADSIYAKNYAQLKQRRVYIRLSPTLGEYRIYEVSSQPLLVREIPDSVCFPNQLGVSAYYTPTGAISQGHTLTIALQPNCRVGDPQMEKLVMTVGNAVYEHVR